LLAVLGFAPPIFEALEVSHHVTVEEVCRQFPEIRKFPVLQSGDVHFRDGFLGIMELEMQTPTVAEIRLAFDGAGGRAMRITSPV
jgi:hypothetical protein